MNEPREFSNFSGRRTVIGDGPTILVFHGGPGFDHRYLVPYLSFLEHRFRLVFFDQLGCGGAASTSAGHSFEKICLDAAEVMAEHRTGSHLAVIAHSFGAAVLLGALRQLSDTRVSGLLINPVPTAKPRFDEMRAALFAKMGSDLTNNLANLSTAILRRADLAPILPYYLSPNSTAELSDLSFDFALYNEVYSSMESFDVSNEVSRLSDCDVVNGRDDFVADVMVSDLHQACRSVNSIHDAGHFPFAEQQASFQALALKLLARI